MAHSTSFRHTIAARLILLVAVVATPLLALEIYYALAEAATARQQALARSDEAAHSVLARIESHIHNTDSVLVTIAATLPLRRDAASIHQGNATLAKIKPLLPPYINSLTALDPDGNLLYSAEPDPLNEGGFNASDRQFFKNALRTKTLVIGKPIISRLTGKRVLVLARAVREPDSDKLIGVVAASILLDGFQQIFDAEKLPKESLITLTDREGTILARSIAPEKWIGVNLSQLPSFDDSILSQQGAREIVSADGVKRLAAIAWSNDMPWLVFVGIPSHIAFAPSQAHLAGVLLFTLLIAALSISAAGGIARGIATPLRRLSADAARLAQGDLSHRSAVQAHGEVGNLANSFNAMAHELELRSINLHASEQRFRATFEQAAVGIAHVALDGSWLMINQRLCEILGYSRNQLWKHKFDDIVAVEDRHDNQRLIPQLLAAKIPTYSSEQRYIRGSGERIWANLTATLVRDDDNAPAYFLFALENIEERKRHEALIAGQKQVLESIARGEPVKQTLHTLLEVIEAQNPEMLCSILLLDADGSHLHHGAAPSLPQGYMQAIDGGAIGACAGSCGTAAFRKEAVFVDDIANDPLWRDYRDLALQYDLRACWSTPIMNASQRVLGTFAIYYRKPGPPPAEHLQLIAITTHTAAIAIDREQAEHEREQLLTQIDAARRDAVAAHDVLSSVFTRMNDGIVALDRTWRYTYVNDNAAKLLNRDKPEDLLGKHIWTEYPDGETQPFGQAYRRALDTQEVIYFEDHYAPWERWFENRIYPSPEGITVYFTDISQRKQAEQALNDERALLQQVMANSPVGIMVIEPNGKIALANQSAQEMLDMTGDKVTQRVFAVPDWIITDFDGTPSPVDQQPFARTLASGRSVFDAEHAVSLPSGRNILLSVNAAPLFDEAGVVKSVVVVIADVTERRKIMLALRASEKKFAVAFRSSPDAMTITSINHGSIIEVNDASLRLTGYSREEMLGQSSKSLGIWAENSDREHYITTMREQGSVRNIELPFRKKSGEIRTGLVSGELIELEGQPHILGIIRDVTEQKQAEAQILQLNAELEQRVLERTAQLESANKELEAFSYSVSHDLKAPLRGIDGYSQLLEEDYQDKLDEEGRNFLRNIRQGAAQMHALIQDLLTYSRMERRSLGSDRISLPECVDALTQGYTHEIAEHGVTLQIDIPPLSVQADRDGLSIVLRNLLDNALKFVRNRSDPRVEIGARREGGKVVLWVRDNGIGFDMKFHERIFEVFSRLQRAEDYPGTGVGLALVRKAMQRMGGRVWAESTPGAGATFFLELTHEKP